jgi:hypothetical protein
VLLRFRATSWRASPAQASPLLASCRFRSCTWSRCRWPLSRRFRGREHGAPGYPRSSDHRQHRRDQRLGILAIAAAALLNVAQKDELPAWFPAKDTLAAILAGVWLYAATLSTVGATVSMALAPKKDAKSDE